MDYGLYVSAAGADTQARRMEVVAHNLTNVDTVGFKEELAVLQARHSRAVRGGMDVAGSRGINDLGSGVSIAETTTNYSPGTLKRTGRTWDMAIDGDGFFVVDNNGQQLLTRAGDFQLDPQGRLLNQQGYSVLADDGSSIIVNPGFPTRVHGDGFLEHSGGGQFIGLAKPASLGDLVRVGKNTFRSLTPLRAMPQDERRVVDGYLEISGVRPVRAMVEMIETSRAYEANVKMIQHQDQLTGALISKLLRSR